MTWYVQYINEIVVTTGKTKAKLKCNGIIT